MKRKYFLMEGGADAVREFLQTLRAGGILIGRPKPAAASPHLFERRRIEQAIRKANGNLADAARDLGMRLASLSRKIRRLGLDR